MSLGCGWEAEHFYVLEVVLLVEEVLQLHLKQASGIIVSNNNKE